MGHHSSKDANEEKMRKKNSRDLRLFVPDELNNMHTVVVPRTLLGDHSLLFREMVENGSIKKMKKIQLEGVVVIGVLKALQYVENGSVNFENVNEVAETIKVAKKYKIDKIEEMCLQYLSQTLTANNVCEVYEYALQNEYPDLIYKCMRTIDEDAEKVLESNSFCDLKQYSVMDIIKRDSLNVKSETVIFDACLKWGESEVRKSGQNIDDTFNLKHVLGPVLTYVRFKNMTSVELSNPIVNEFYASIAVKEPTDSKFRSSTMSTDEPKNNHLNPSSQSRTYLTYYVHGLEVFDSNQSSIVSGETFNMKAEVLKGKVFLCGVNLALKTFSTRMTATCLYATLSATNLRSNEQKNARGTFLDTASESSLTFPNPLFLRDTDIAVLSLNVRMAGNLSPLTGKNDIEIVVPASKEIALKIQSDNTRCIFKDIIYFY